MVFDVLPSTYIQYVCTQAYGMAGARIGYAIFSTPRLASALFKVKGVFPVNSLAQIGAVALLIEEQHMRECVRSIVDERNKVPALLM